MFSTVSWTVVGRIALLLYKGILDLEFFLTKLKQFIVQHVLFVTTFLRGYIPSKNLLILVSILVGIFSGLTAVFLKTFAHFIHNAVQHFEATSFYVTLFVYPFLGIVLSVVYVKYIQKAKIGKSITDIILAIEKHYGHLPFVKIPITLVTSALTVGLGGSTGLEAPITVIGSTVGSNTATLFKFTKKERIVLLASGASAGVAAIFNCPIAGVLFSIEVLLGDFSIPTIIPILVASASASVVSKLLYDGQLFFAVTSDWNVKAIPFYLLLGVVIGFLSVYFSRVVSKVKTFFAIRKNDLKRAVMGGTVLGFMILLFPTLYGEGYSSITTLLNGQYDRLLDRYYITHFFGLNDHMLVVLLVVTLLIFLKPIAAAVTLGSGGNGGVFGPSLFVGALSGFVFVFSINSFTGLTLSPVNFIAAGMAGALSGIMQAPLTAIFLIAEVTGGYVLFVPLMIVSAVAFFISRYFEPHTMYKKRLVKKGVLSGLDRDKWVLNHLKLNELIDNHYAELQVDMTLREFVSVISQTNRNIFPVLDPSRHLLGIVMLDDVREVMFKQEHYDVLTVRDLMSEAPDFAYKNESLVSVMKKFEEHDCWILPVLYRNKYVGFVSKSSVFGHYRQLLIKQAQEVG